MSILNEHPVAWDEQYANLTAKQVMQLFRKHHGGMVRKIQTLKIDWPDAIRTTNALIDYISAGFVYQKTGEPIIYSPLQKALQEYTLSVSNNTNDIDRLSIYLRTLLSEITCVASFIQLVDADGENTIWTAESGMSVQEATQKANGSRLSVSEHDNPVPETVCLIFTEAVLTNGTRYIFDESAGQASTERICEA